MARVHEIHQSAFWYTFGPNAPEVRVKSGDIVVAETRDARGYDKQMQPLSSAGRNLRQDTDLRQSNPLVGPIFVEEAMRGDVLAVHIESIELTRNSAWSRLGPNFGSLTQEVPGRRFLLNPPLEERRVDWALDTESQTASLSLPDSVNQGGPELVTIPLHPFIGSIGVAPRFGRVETALAPGEYGGNMDCVDTAAGTTLYFPVWVDGAYLAFGDVHAAQGDGELGGSALETSGRVRLRLEVLKGEAYTTWEWPRLENDEFLMTAGSSRPLFEAMSLAVHEMADWMEQRFQLQRTDAMHVLTQVIRMRIGNVVDPNYTVVAKLPKTVFPGR